MYSRHINNKQISIIGHGALNASLTHSAPDIQVSLYTFLYIVVEVIALGSPHKISWVVSKGVLPIKYFHTNKSISCANQILCPQNFMEIIRQSLS